ncbi:hypothetical protein Btru_066841 [Bulinus truncatus]|nr:hypothetical protein Btru_066841 [Bulinus truncatus]
MITLDLPAGVNTDEKYDSLHDYCVQSLPDYGLTQSGRAKYTGKDFIRLCSYIDNYTSCIVHTRHKALHLKDYEMKPFEYYFPDEYDLKRATYMYCSEHLLIYGLEIFTMSDTESRQCESQLDLTECSPFVMFRKEMAELTEAVTANHDPVHPTIWTLSCT